MGLLCKILGHKADRGGARHDGEDYWTQCTRCGTALVRPESGWRLPTTEEVANHVGHRQRRTELDSEAGISS